ncbi:O-antigen ligase family protein [Alkalilimnicola sp. S0819]|uniref:O-antigen ligase family protein n=1 Tax=Alkalilimnicola sp. S0819 TaxID=2613922 RepID=UPI001869B440|nr:O-antigen ligase family protein [Alkalilimnicola sp. S0819]
MARLPDGGWSLALVLVGVYLWALIATPQYRFDILATLHYEKLLVAAAWLSLLLAGRVQARLSTTSGLLLLLYLFMWVSHLFSPYPQTADAQWWVSTYWKLLLFYFLVLFTVSGVRDVQRLFAALVVVSLLYQLHSWLDFVQGGAYVWQQGVRRIIGVWSASGMGAPNAFGMLALFTLPFALAWRDVSTGAWLRRALLGGALLCAASILFSGTRAALAGLIFYLLLRYGRALARPAVLMGLALVGVLALAALPTDMRLRYLSLVMDVEQLERPAEELASASAQSRLQGLRDGVALGFQRPLLGYGPGASAAARAERLPGEQWLDIEGEALQLHNLYGQLMAEGGLPGTLLAVLLMLHVLGSLRRLRRDADPLTAHWAGALMLGVLVFMFYGLASHTLYRFHWLLLFAAQAALVGAWRRASVPAGTPPAGLAGVARALARPRG